MEKAKSENGKGRGKQPHINTPLFCFLLAIGWGKNFDYSRKPPRHRYFILAKALGGEWREFCLFYDG